MSAKRGNPRIISRRQGLCQELQQGPRRSPGVAGAADQHDVALVVGATLASGNKVFRRRLVVRVLLQASGEVGPPQPHRPAAVRTPAELAMVQLRPQAWTAHQAPRRRRSRSRAHRSRRTVRRRRASFIPPPPASLPRGDGTAPKSCDGRPAGRSPADPASCRSRRRSCAEPAPSSRRCQRRGRRPA